MNVMLKLFLFIKTRIIRCYLRTLFLNLIDFSLLRIVFRKTCVPAGVWRALPRDITARQWTELCLAVILQVCVS